MKNTSKNPSVRGLPVSVSLSARATGHAPVRPTHPRTLDGRHAEAADFNAVLVPVVEEYHVLVGHARVLPELAKVLHFRATVYLGQRENLAHGEAGLHLEKVHYLSRPPERDEDQIDGQRGPA